MKNKVPQNYNLTAVNAKHFILGAKNMIGVVKMVNSISGMVAVETENGDFTIFQLMADHEVEVGDRISGELDTPGDETFRNNTKMEMIHVFVAECNASPDAAKRRVA